MKSRRFKIASPPSPGIKTSTFQFSHATPPLPTGSLPDTAPSGRKKKTVTCEVGDTGMPLRIPALHFGTAALT